MPVVELSPELTSVSAAPPRRSAEFDLAPATARLVIGGLLTLLLVICAQLLAGEGGLGDRARLERALAEQQQHNAALAARNNQLYAEVADLTNGMEAIEERARAELGMIQPEEEYFLIAERP